MWLKVGIYLNLDGFIICLVGKKTWLGSRTLQQEFYKKEMEKFLTWYYWHTLSNIHIITTRIIILHHTANLSVLFPQISHWSTVWKADHQVTQCHIHLYSHSLIFLLCHLHFHNANALELSVEAIHIIYPQSCCNCTFSLFQGPLHCTDN